MRNLVAWRAVSILVTGGAGFIGSHVVEALLADGHEVRVLDSLHPLAHSGQPDYLPDEAELILGDVRDSETVERALDGVTAVSHQAAMVGLGVDMSDLTAFVSHNDLGTAVLLEALAARSFGGRLVLASSMVVYGEGRYACAEHGVLPAPPRSPGDLRAGRFEPACQRCVRPLEPQPISEDAPLAPASVYAATKVHQEHLAFAFARETGVASIFASALARGEPPRVFEDGRQLRDFVHVRDVARVNVLALTAPEPYRGALNVASGIPRSVGEMADALVAAAGDDAPPPVITGEWRAGDVRHVFASPARAREALGFVAEEDFEAGMREFASLPLRA